MSVQLNGYIYSFLGKFHNKIVCILITKDESYARKKSVVQLLIKSMYKMYIRKVTCL